MFDDATSVETHAEKDFVVGYPVLDDDSNSSAQFTVQVNRDFLFISGAPCEHQDQYSNCKELNATLHICKKEKYQDIQNSCLATCHCNIR